MRSAPAPAPAPVARTGDVPEGADSLYVHVPFCAKKCSYCAFYSEEDLARKDRYVGALEREIASLPAVVRPRTLFFGGGTPSLLTVAQWERVLAALDRRGWLAAEEITVECNPATLSGDKARMLVASGVNRISLGVQSLDERLLERLGRIHDRRQVFESVDRLRRAGVANLNLDLMFAIPGQGLDVWQATLSEVLGLAPEHLSCYEVIYEEDTPLFAELRAGRFAVDEDLACAMYETWVERADAAGFVLYELANSARGAVGPDGLPDRACRHNVNYWRGGDYLAAGPSATGRQGRVTWRNVSNIAGYCDAWESGRRPVEWREELELFGWACEVAAFGLRMTSGWSFADFERRTGMDLRGQWSGAMDALVGRGHGERTDTGFRLTREGLRFADAAASEFLLSEA